MVEHGGVGGHGDVGEGVPPAGTETAPTGPRDPRVPYARPPAEPGPEAPPERVRPTPEPAAPAAGRADTVDPTGTAGAAGGPGAPGAVGAVGATTTTGATGTTNAANAANTPRTAGGTETADAAHAAGAPGAVEDDPYTATALDAPWTADPAGGTGPRERTEETPARWVPAPRRAPGTDPAPTPDPRSARGADTPPEPSGAEGPGEVLRFGPGVPYRHSGEGDRIAPTAVLPLPSSLHPSVPDSGSPAPAPRRGRLRRALRYLPAVLVLVAACGWLWWQRFGPDLTVREVTVHSPTGAPTCDGTAEILGVLRTNGRPGEVRYEWVRSDGTTSGELVESVPRGREEVRLRLLWTFRGEGVVSASARLRLIDPPAAEWDSDGAADGDGARVEFTYTCP